MRARLPPGAPRTEPAASANIRCDPHHAMLLLVQPSPPPHRQSWVDAFRRPNMAAQPVRRETPRGGASTHLLRDHRLLECIENFYGNLVWLRRVLELTSRTGRPGSS